MTALKDEPFLEVMLLSYDKTKAGDHKCRIEHDFRVCGKEFACMEDFINHLKREHLNDELPKSRSEKKK